MNMNALLEAQKDFEGIEKFISNKFGIPMDARIMVHGLDADILEAQINDFLNPAEA